jgi:hypothetical protein
MILPLQHFRKKPGKVLMEKCNIADVVKLKCEERNHYNSNCLMAAIHVLWKEHVETSNVEHH